MLTVIRSYHHLGVKVDLVEGQETTDKGRDRKIRRFQFDFAGSLHAHKTYAGACQEIAQLVNSQVNPTEINLADYPTVRALHEGIGLMVPIPDFSGLFIRNPA